MNTSMPVRLKQALEDSGNAWLLGYWGNDADAMLERAAEDLEAFLLEYERRFGERPDPFAFLQKDRLKAKAFFQLDALQASVEMKIMIWRILLGCDIVRVEFRYTQASVMELTATLKTPYEEEEIYRTTQSRDFRVLRHFGATEDNGHLVLQGYYA
jgi:hypothetical protein